MAEFIAENPQYVVEGNSMNYMSDNNGDSYNLCHCMSKTICHGMC